jgi:F-type H+-transporting ATPase subunit epsilon
MNLRIFLPEKIVIDQEVTKVVAEAEDGSFGILPKHIDFAAALIPGIFSFESKDGEVFLAIDEGILIKCGSDVWVSTRKAVLGKNLGELKETVEHEFRSMDDQERKTRSILAKLEADFTKRFMKMQEKG